MITPYGSWPSPITADHLIKEALRFGSIAIDPPFFYYIEGRPTEQGRSVLIRGSLSGQHQEILPTTFDVRTKVHEYGGKCILAHKQHLYFVNCHDQDIYLVTAQGEVKRLTQDPSLRYADFSITPDGSFLYAVAERHPKEPAQGKVENMLIQLSLSTLQMEIIASGYDFYAAPRVSPDGTTLAWFCWSHPNMPWDGTELWIGEISPSQTLLNPRKIAGGVEESVTSPQWSPDHVLHFVSDKTGFWNLYRYLDNTITPFYPNPCTIDFGAPHWIFGVERYGFLQDGSLVAIGTLQGEDSLYHLDPKKSAPQRLHLPLTSLSDLYVLQDTLIFKGSSPELPESLLAVYLATQDLKILKTSQPVSINPGYISRPVKMTCPTEPRTVTYGFYYPPTHPHSIAPAHSAPPLILRCHGGPTAHVSPRFNLETLYFTSRGFAVFEINYSGSTGYGRDYRNRLRGKWGVMDVQDCVYAACYLCDQGLADPSRLIIKGGSAGGFTTLCAMIFSKTFQAGSCYYGVSDLEALAINTHKMELHYLDRLIGPYPQQKTTYIERSPIHHTQRLSQPIIFFQGAEDRVVPPAQSEKMYQALCQKNIPSAYLLFQHEAHGFRRSETIKKCVETELLFYAQIFHLSLADPPASPEPLTDGTLLSSGINFS